VAWVKISRQPDLILRVGLEFVMTWASNLTWTALTWTALLFLFSSMPLSNYFLASLVVLVIIISLVSNPFLKLLKVLRNKFTLCSS
jgi:hypothetical protein